MNDIFAKKTTLQNNNEEYFSVNGVLQINNNQQKIDLLVNSKPGEENIRKMFNKHLKIVVFGLTKYKDDINNFGDTIIKFTYDEEQYICILNIGNIPQTFEFIYNNIGIELDYINRLTNPYDDTKAETILVGLKSKHQSISSSKNKLEKEKTDKIKLKTDDKKLKELKNIINDTLKEAEEIEQKMQGISSSSEMKKFKDTVDELRKLRMGRNSENLIEILEKIIELIEGFELEYISYLKKQEIGSIKNSIINELDIVGEYEKFKKAEKVKQVSKVGTVTKSFDDIYYHNLGKSGIYYKLLGKELKTKIFNKNTFFGGLYKYIELIIIFIIFDLTIYLIYPYILNPGTNNEKPAIYFYLWNFGLLGILVFFGKFFTKKNYITAIIVYVITIIAFIFIHQKFIGNFAF